MLSSLLQIGGFSSLTYGTYVLGGRGPAAFVAGFALLIVGQAADGIHIDVNSRFQSVRARLHKQKG